MSLPRCGSQNLLHTTEEPSYGQIVKVANVCAWMEVRTGCAIQAGDTYLHDEYSYLPYLRPTRDP